MDDDAPGFTLSTNTLTLDDSTGNNIGSFIVTLNSEPASPVNLTFTSNNPTECTVTTPLALNSSNYTTGVSVTVTGAVDDVVDGDATCQISAISITGDATYAALDPADVGTVNVTVNNDDTASVTVLPLTLTLSETVTATNNSDTFLDHVRV